MVVAKNSSICRNTINRFTSEQVFLGVSICKYLLSTYYSIEMWLVHTCIDVYLAQCVSRSSKNAQDFVSNKFFAIHWELPGVCERIAEISHLRMWLLIKTTTNRPTVCIIKCFVNYAITAISHLIGSTRKRNLWHMYYIIYTPYTYVGTYTYAQMNTPTISA